jgi:hypothetical protein
MFAVRVLVGRSFDYTVWLAAAGFLAVNY